MKLTRLWFLAAAVAVVAVALVGCGGSETAPSSSTSSASGAEAGGAEGGGAETQATYSDPGGRFSLQYPANWTYSASALGGVKFESRDQMLILDVIANAGSDAMAFATRDEGSLSAQFPSYHKLGLAQSPDVTGAAVLSFEWQSTSAVTGKAVLERAERYYLPEPAGKIAVLTDSAPPSLFDPQNSHDLAKTVKVS